MFTDSKNSSQIPKLLTYSKNVHMFKNYSTIGKGSKLSKNIHEFGKYSVIQYFSKFKNVNWKLFTNLKKVQKIKKEKEKANTKENIALTIILYTSHHIF